MHEIVRSATIHEEFARIAATYPDRVAVSADGISMTYAQLDHRANQAASALRARDVAGGKVGLAVDRTVEMVVGILAVLKAGAAYVPLDPTYPRSRLQFIVADADLRAILVGSGVVVPGLGQNKTPLVPLEHTDDQTEDTVVDQGQVSGSDLAYVIYTSGSTGVPKGVMVEHRHVLSLFDGCDQHFTFGPEDVWTVIHSFAFDFSVWEIFGAILHGGRAVVVPRQIISSPKLLWRLVQDERVTVLNVTPSYFARLDEADDGSGVRLRHLIFGGEALELTRLASWYRRYGSTGPQLVNMYGITETTVHVTVCPLTPAHARQARSLIGKPLPHLTIRLLDDRLQPVPEGDIGEICVAGASVARGYLKRNELTAQRFIDDPLAPSDGRLYRSGDLGRLTPSGDVEYLGRSDDQVKVRGFRIEPAEIQVHLRDHEAVQDAAVVVREGQHSSHQLVAYVVPQGEAPTADALRHHLASRLPAYMVPGLFVSVAALPLTANGKLDRTALPDAVALEAARPRATASLSAFGARLLRIWCAVLELDTLGADDTFHSVGGDSIQAIRIVGMAQEQGISFNVEHLLAHRTVAALADFLEAKPNAAKPPISEERGEPLAQADRALLPPGVTDAYTMTSLQLGMLFHSEGADHTTYHSVSSAVVSAAFDETRLRACVGQLTGRHEALRTSFDLETFSQPMQLLHASVQPRLNVADLTGYPAGQQELAVQQRLAEEEATPVDWKQVPLVRFSVDVLTSASFRLTWTEHHALLDGWSSNSLFAELIGLYAGHAETRRQTVDLPPLREYVAAETKALASSAGHDFWRSQLRDVPVAVHPRGRAEDRSTFHIEPVTMPDRAFVRLSEIARTHHTTPRALLAAAHAITLGHCLDAATVMVGLVIHGRLERAGGDEMLGLFLNTVPMPVRVEGTLLDIAIAITAFERAVHPHRHYPLAAIQRAAPPGLELDNLISFTDFHQLESLTRNGIIDGAVENRVRIHYPLAVEAERPPGSDSLKVSVQFRTDRWSAMARTEFVERLSRSLTAAILEPDSPPAQVFRNVPHGGAVQPTTTSNRAALNTEAQLLPTGPPSTPATPLAGNWDSIVAELWQSVLGVPPPSRETAFTEIGGDSLSVMRLVGRYARRGFAVNVRDLLANDTVAAQAALLADHANDKGGIGDAIRKPQTRGA